MTATERVVSILRNQTTRRIHFTYTGMLGISISVDRSTFERVASAMEQNPPRVTVSEVRSLPGGNAGRYSNSANTLEVLPYSGSRVWEATIVHECVHASLDLT